MIQCFWEHDIYLGQRVKMALPLPKKANMEIVSVQDQLCFPYLLQKTFLFGFFLV